MDWHKEKRMTHQEEVHALFLHHSREIRRFILALVPDFSSADDVFQETFLTVSRKADDFQTGSNFLGWVCAIARFKVLEALRSRKGQNQMLSAEVIEALCAGEPSPESEEEKLEVLSRCIGDLPAKTRKVVELRYQQAHKPPEIARYLDWTVESVYVTLSRARSLLRHCMERRLAGHSVEVS